MDLLKGGSVLVLKLRHLTEKGKQSSVPFRAVCRGAANDFVEELANHVDIGMASPPSEVDELVGETLLVASGKLAAVSQIVAAKKTGLAEVREEDAAIVIHSDRLARDT